MKEGDTRRTWARLPPLQWRAAISMPMPMPMPMLMVETTAGR